MLKGRTPFEKNMVGSRSMAKNGVSGEFGRATAIREYGRAEVEFCARGVNVKWANTFGAPVYLRPVRCRYFRFVARNVIAIPEAYHYRWDPW